MTEGLLLGIAAAISFGSSDALAAIVARRVGTLRAAAGALLASLISLGLLLLLVDPRLPARLADLPLVLALGALAGIGYLCLVNGLRLGPVSVVSPVGASIGAASVLLAVAFLGDRPSAVQWIAVALTTFGAVLVALVRGRGAGLRAFSGGPVFALLAVICYAIAVVGLQGPIRSGGVLPTVFVWRVGNVVVTTLALVGASRLGARRTGAGPVVAATGDVALALALDRDRRRHRLPAAPPGVVSLGGIALVGLLETSGQALRATGLSLAPAWLLGLVGSLGPAVVVATGVAVLGERPAPSQWLGMALLGAGLALLALG